MKKRQSDELKSEGRHGSPQRREAADCHCRVSLRGLLVRAFFVNAWRWLRAQSRAKPVTMPWPVDRDKTIQVDEFWELLNAHYQEDRRMNYVTRAFFAMCAGPVLGDILIDTGLHAIGLVVGGVITTAAGLMSAYYRGY